MKITILLDEAELSLVRNLAAQHGVDPAALKNPNVVRAALGLPLLRHGGQNKGNRAKQLVRLQNEVVGLTDAERREALGEKLWALECARK